MGSTLMVGPWSQSLAKENKIENFYEISSNGCSKVSPTNVILGFKDFPLNFRLKLFLAQNKSDRENPLKLWTRQCIFPIDKHFSLFIGRISKKGFKTLTLAQTAKKV